ncbi:MAG: heavy-metal-associated domain-containing protein [Methylotenera sp.]|nr:heavy-metal-associated domain-containing protein [Methylotenera sp.]MDP2281232.1 heavy-metal-associated domain-containing protein [Methylotenera sp.]MDP3061327.1 heavy-metal-associated domain-containing protein [Methylotenera sp.]
MQTEQLKVTGMTCGGCSNKVTNALKAVNGVEDVVVSLADGQAIVQYNEALSSPAQLRSAVTNPGFSVDAANESQVKDKGCCG